MKLNIIILVLTLTLSSVSFAAPRPGSMADPDNPHNMSSLATHLGPKAKDTVDGGTEQICVFCHTPHSAAAQTPLWNRPDPKGPNGDGSFPIYASAKIADPAINATTKYDPANSNYPSGASRMCLSCHDGATSINVLLANPPIQMEGGIETVTNFSAIINLSTSHPISFTYNQTVVDYLGNADYHLPSETFTPLDGAGQMQCTTCHDPHEDTRDNGTYGGLPFWRNQSDAASYDGVCNSCHAPPASAPPVHP